MPDIFDFEGWATRPNTKCSDGRTILPDAFKHHDGQKVPLVWNHQHDDPRNVLGYAILEHRDGGLYAKCSLNDTDSGKHTRKAIGHGDVISLSIFANRLKQNGANVVHGIIREVSIVLAGANPGAFIENVLRHGAYSDEEDAVIWDTENNIIVCHSEEDSEVSSNNEELEHPEVSSNNEELEHSEDETVQDVFDNMTEEQKLVAYGVLAEALGFEVENDDLDEENASKKNPTDVFDNMTDKQKQAVYYAVAKALKTTNTEETEEPIEHNEGGNDMKENVFSQTENVQTKGDVLTHADQEAIIAKAKSSSVGSLKHAMEIFVEDNSDTLAHGFESVDLLFPDSKLIRPGAPEVVGRDMTWSMHAINRAHKTPYSRVRTRQTDIRNYGPLGRGYTKGDEKGNIPDMKVVNRTTDPQTIYLKDAMHRDDILDITDFDAVEYQYAIMKDLYKEQLALAALVGDGRSDSDADKISETHIRPIWTDDEVYTIRKTVDFEAMKAQLQGTDTGTYFGDNFVKAEAIIEAATHARESYKGSGSLDFYCTQRTLNEMLLARDRNGHRIFESKADLAQALNVNGIFTVEPFDGLTRTTTDSKTMKLLGIFVNMNDYNFGSTKGGELTRFDQFDINFNKEIFLIEGRVSGALTRLSSAIVLEEDVTAPVDPDPAG